MKILTILLIFISLTGYSQAPAKVGNWTDYVTSTGGSGIDATARDSANKALLLVNTLDTSLNKDNVIVATEVIGENMYTSVQVDSIFNAAYELAGLTYGGGAVFTEYNLLVTNEINAARGYILDGSGASNYANDIDEGVYVHYAGATSVEITLEEFALSSDATDWIDIYDDVAGVYGVNSLWVGGVLGGLPKNDAKFTASVTTIPEGFFYLRFQTGDSGSSGAGFKIMFRFKNAEGAYL